MKNYSFKFLIKWTLAHYETMSVLGTVDGGSDGASCRSDGSD